MSLRVYNSLTRQKELFEPLKPGKVGMYLCGMTVYKSPHIGHMVGPVLFDAIKRYLVFKGYDVTWVVNITDVDDKLIETARRENSTVSDLAERYTREYQDCLLSLGVDTIDRFPKASKHIPEIVDIIQKLIERGFAYVAEGGDVWFDVSRDLDYGKLSHRRPEDQESGQRALEGSGKRNPADFSLWKAAKEGEPAWEAPWGSGRPGWHIECSAMSMKYLGETFDIHGGGMDLMFPHHENELAQSESATGQPFVKYWLHNGLTRIKTKLKSGEWADEKMSGSIGNVVPAAELVQKHGAELIRYMLLSTHYRRPIEFTDDVLTSAKKGLSVFHRLFERVERLLGMTALDEEIPDMDRISATLLETEQAAFARNVLALKMKFLEMMDDDFNTAGAIAVLHELAGAVNALIERHNIEQNKQADLVQAAAAATQTLRKLALVLGLFRPGLNGRGSAQTDASAALVEQLMSLLIALRAEARASKNFALADRIRDGLSAAGITLEDRAGGTDWRR